MAGYYALASQSMLMQHMLHLRSHSKYPRLMKFSEFAKWEPRFRAHLGFVHSDCSRCLDDVYITPLLGNETSSYEPNALSVYTQDEKKVLEIETKAYATLTML